jgi:cytochrome c peroxidase
MGAVFTAALVLSCASDDDSAAGPGDSPATPPAQQTGGALCVDGKSTVGEYPTRDLKIEVRATLPNLQFRTDEPYGGFLRFSDFFEPCARESRVLVIRVSAGWCGTCRWHAAHTADLRAQSFGGRLRLLDLLITDDENLPALTEDAVVWRGRVTQPEAVAVDPLDQFQVLNPTHLALPLIALVDTRTMRLMSTLSDPDPDTLNAQIRRELARLDDQPFPISPAPEKFDGLFTKNQWDMLHEMTLPTAPPPDLTNAYADNPGAQSLGRSLFADKLLSPSGSVACATCHDPNKEFADASAQSTGMAKMDRNAPSVALAAYSRWQFWDGRADTLWMQALEPLENSKEMGSSRLFVAHQVFDRYRAAYETVFGPMPPLSNAFRFPPTGKPGEDIWPTIPAADQDAITRVFVNVGKSIAAYERSIRIAPNPLDAYIGGDLNALTSEQKAGAKAFFDAGCAQCHYGSRLTDDVFHATRFPTGRQDGVADRGRIDGVDPLLKSELNAKGPYSDYRDAGEWLDWLAGRKEDPLAAQQMTGAFKTPTLRGLTVTGPYGHGGVLKSIGEVVTVYTTAGLSPADTRAVGISEPWLSPLREDRRSPIEHFLGVLSAPITNK